MCLLALLKFNLGRVVWDIVRENGRGYDVVFEAKAPVRCDAVLNIMYMYLNTMNRK